MHHLRNPTRVVLLAIALGAAADQLFYNRRLGISAPLFVALGLGALAWLSAAEKRLPTRANLWLGGAALFFAGCLAWRDAPALTAFNLLATIALLVLLAACFRAEPLAAQAETNLLARLLAGCVEILARPAPLISYTSGQARVEPARLRALVPVGRGLLLAAPALFFFTALLTAADTVFASYVTQVLNIRLPFDLSSVLGHGIWVVFVGWLCAGGLLVAQLGDHSSVVRDTFDRLIGGALGLVRDRAAPQIDAEDELPAEGATQRLAVTRRAPLAIGPVEGITVLASVDALFGGFMAIQGAYFFGGLDTLERTGMTYAEYARRGFFELLAVACVALGMLCALAIATRRGPGRERRVFNAASAAMIVLVLGLLASAFERMWLYEQAYGYTQLRLYTHSFMIWLAVVLALFLVALLRERSRLFTLGTLGTALVYLALLNIANPDALIVRENVARYQAGGAIDTYYLAGLSADATPALADSLGALDPAARAEIGEALAQQRAVLEAADAAEGWPAWHLGRAQARWSLLSIRS